MDDEMPDDGSCQPRLGMVHQMSKAAGAALTASRVEFAVDRFVLVEGERFDVHGTWSGIRGRRFMRPALSLTSGGESIRLLADLAHKPWAAEDNAPWFASFPCTIQAHEVAGAELTVAPDITVELPSPVTHGHPAPPKAADGPRDEREELRQERDRAVKQATHTRLLTDRALAERDAAIASRDAAQSERAAALEERDAARRERDAVLEERDAARRERDAVVEERDAAVKERDAAVKERDAALVARDLALTERGALVETVKRFEAEARTAGLSQPEPPPIPTRPLPRRSPSHDPHVTYTRTAAAVGAQDVQVLVQRTIAVTLLLVLGIVLLLILRVL